MDNIENNLLKIINEKQEIIDEVSLKDVSDFVSNVTSSSVGKINDYTNMKVESFFNNPTVKNILINLITDLIIKNPLILKEVTNNVLDNIKINVEKK
jgi:hypothetical protein